jgi:hypothetical protein
MNRQPQVKREEVAAAQRLKVASIAVSKAAMNPVGVV